MEKLRAALEVLNKYHFWILCGLIVALSFGSWYWAIANEEKDYGDRQKAIDGTCSLVDKITKNNEHPSPDYIKEIQESGKRHSEQPGGECVYPPVSRDAGCQSPSPALCRPERPGGIRSGFR